MWLLDSIKRNHLHYLLLLSDFFSLCNLPVGIRSDGTRAYMQLHFYSARQQSGNAEYCFRPCTSGCVNVSIRTVTKKPLIRN